MPYDYKAIGDQIDALKNSGNEAQAWAMFNGLSGMGDATQAAGGVAGNLDSYLRTRWGDSTAKQWINGMDTKYGNTLFDPTTGKWAGMGAAANQSGTIAGWDPTQYGAKGMGIGGAGYVPQGDGSGAAGFSGAAYNQSPGMQGDMKTPMPGMSPVDMARAGYGGATSGSGTGTGAAQGAGGAPVPGTVPGAPPGSYAAPTRPAGSGTPFDFMNDAGVQFRLKNGFDKIQNSAAAGGGLMSGATIKDLEEFRQGVNSEEYDKAFGRYTNARDFGEDQFRNDRNFGRSTYQDDRDYGRSVYRDDRDYGEDVRRNNRNFDESQFQDRRNFQVDEDRYNSDTEYRRAVDAYNREEDARRYDQNFDYTARTGDRTFNSQTLADLARQGMTGSQGNAQLQSTLAAMIMQSIMQGAGAGAQGNMGGSQNWLDLIASIFGQGGKR